MKAFMSSLAVLVVAIFVVGISGHGFGGFKGGRGRGGGGPHRGGSRGPFFGRSKMPFNYTFNYTKTDNNVETKTNVTVFVINEMLLVNSVCRRFNKVSPFNASFIEYNSTSHYEVVAPIGFGLPCFFRLYTNNDFAKTNAKLAEINGKEVSDTFPEVIFDGTGEGVTEAKQTEILAGLPKSRKSCGGRPLIYLLTTSVDPSKTNVTEMKFLNTQEKYKVTFVPSPPQQRKPFGRPFGKHRH